MSSGLDSDMEDEARDSDEGEAEPIRIKKLKIDSSLRVPIASFESLGMPLSSKFKGASAAVFDVKSSYLSSTETNMNQVLAMEIPIVENGDEGKKSEKFRFEGSTPYNPDNNYKSFAALVDTRTGETVLYPADIFMMMPCVDGFGDHPWRLRMDIARLKDSEKTDTGAEKMAKSDALSATFGTSKKRRERKAKEANRVDDTGLDGEGIDAIVRDAAPSFDPKMKACVPGDELNILPSMNLEATRKEEVFDIDDIIPPYVVEALLCIPEAEAMIRQDRDALQKLVADKSLPVFFLDEIKFLSQDEERRRDQTRNLFFVHILLCLFAKKSGEIRRRNAGFPESWSKDLIDLLFSRYTKENIGGDGKRRNRVMPQVLKDKAFLHALIIMIIHHDYSFMADEFLLGIKIPPEKVSNLCRLARVLNGRRAQRTWIELTLPLPEYEDKKPEKSRKRKK